jgi:hypothetical protein
MKGGKDLIRPDLKISLFAVGLPYKELLFSVLSSVLLKCPTY